MEHGRGGAAGGEGEKRGGWGAADGDLLVDGAEGGRTQLPVASHHPPLHQQLHLLPPPPRPRMAQSAGALSRGPGAEPWRGVSRPQSLRRGPLSGGA